MQLNKIIKTWEVMLPGLRDIVVVQARSESAAVKEAKRIVACVASCEDKEPESVRVRD